MNSYKQYLKYKQKYVNLKNQIGGNPKKLLYLGMNKYFRNSQIDEIKQRLQITDNDIQKSIEMIKIEVLPSDDKFDVIFCTYNNSDILTELQGLISASGSIYFCLLSNQHTETEEIKTFYNSKSFTQYDFITLDEINEGLNIYTTLIDQLDNLNTSCLKIKIDIAESEKKYIELANNTHLYVIHKYFNPSSILNDTYDTDIDGLRYIITCDNTPTIFTIAQHSIYLDLLRKCGETSGTSILQRIIQIGTDLHKKTISLQDASIVEYKTYSYSLARFTILLTGESWYNKYHLYSNNHKDDKIYNDTKRNLSLSKFIVPYNTEIRTNISRDMFIFRRLNRIYMDLCLKNIDLIPDDQSFCVPVWDKMANAINSMFDKDELSDKDESDKDKLLSNVHRFKEIYESHGLISAYETYLWTNHTDLFNITSFIESYKKILPDLTKDTTVKLIIETIHDNMDTIKSDDSLYSLLSKLIKSSLYQLRYDPMLTLNL